ncbi:MAG: tRNA 2-thiouridine(34) synthase MnmA [Spirochaetia bacterium]|nr:tRNA 2-thiouridine(34) synthase MnmA [Spirochaetia bacterium]
MKILVGMSGGIDSSAAALLLQQAGHEVIGATMSLYNPNNPISSNMSGSACFGPSEKHTIEEAKAVCEKLKIPLHILDCSAQYEKFVLDNFTNEYKEGRTPNPCVLCNSYIKFGALLDEARKKQIDFDYYATGHYVKIVEINNRLALAMADDAKKDQSYFLYRLRQDQLSNIIFPLGEMTKSQSRELGMKHGFFGSEKKESQDFYSGDYVELINWPDKVGQIFSSSGKLLGSHNGYWNYTIGQRKGLGISADRPLYVLSLDSSTNTVVVGYEEETYTHTLIAHSPSWMAIERLNEPIEVIAKIRSTSKGARAIIRMEKEGRVKVSFVEKQQAITSGQSVVFYNEQKIILGGAIIA